MNIYQIIANYFSGNASQQEQDTLMLWRKEPENEKTFRELEGVWKLSHSVKTTFHPDVEKAWHKLHVKLEPQITFPQKNKKKYYYTGIAATFILIIAATFFITNIKTAISPEKTSTPIAMLAIAAGDTAEIIVLEDGSKIWLNKNSTFSYPERFDSSHRTVYLYGEAFFEIKRDTSKPFSVFTKTSVTKVLGTSFNIKAYEQNTEVEIIVISGMVEFASLNKKSKIILRANDKGTLNKKTNIIAKTVNKEKKHWWKNSKLRGKIKKAFNKIKKLLKKND